MDGGAGWGRDGCNWLLYEYRPDELNPECELILLPGRGDL